MSNLEWSLLSTVKSLWDGVRRLGRVLLPICCGVFGLCLPRQVLKFSCTEYTWDFYPLNCSWACSFLIFSSSLCMRLWGGEEQLCLSYSGVILGKVWMHSLLQSHTSFVHPCRTHPSQAESCPICGAFGTRWLNHLTELGTCMKILFWNPHNFVPVAWKWNFLQGFAAL